MRQLRHVILNLGLALAVVAPAVIVGVAPTAAVADARSDARTHYQAGVKAYNAGDYKVAIREFSAAQSLAPADLNNYNLALCYDKLGDAEPAIQYYKAYLDKVPNTDKRGEIEASVQRLDAALKSQTAKKADEAKRAEEAKKAIEAKKADEDRKKAEEDAKRKADEDAKKKVDEAPPVAPVAPVGPPVGPQVGPKPDEAPPVGPAPARPGRPGVGNRRGGDSNQIDRVKDINIDEIRDQRVGGGGSGIADRKRPPAKANPRVGAIGGGEPDQQQPDQATPPPTPNDTARPTPGTAGPTNAPNTAPTDKPAQVPVYKKWWFWAVVAVSAYVVYSIASEDSKASNGQGRLLLPSPGTANKSGGGGGMTLWRF